MLLEMLAGEPFGTPRGHEENWLPKRLPGDSGQGFELCFASLRRAVISSTSPDIDSLACCWDQVMVSFISCGVSSMDFRPTSDW